MSDLGGYKYIYRVTWTDGREFSTEDEAREILHAPFANKRGEWQEYRDSHRNLQITFVERNIDDSVRRKTSWAIEGIEVSDP